MYSITLVVGNSSTPWTLLYKTEATSNPAALTIHHSLTTGAGLDLHDDFGQTVHAAAGELKGYMSEDLDQSKLAHIEFGLHRARMQLDMSKRAEVDPALRAGRMMQGPGVITPMGAPTNGFSR